MVCDKCEKKLGKVITPDPWKSGARNTTESGGRKVNENKALSSAKMRFDPVGQSFRPCRCVWRNFLFLFSEFYCGFFRCCRICRSKVHQVGSHYCQACAYKKGICAMCGKKLLDTKNYKQSATWAHHRPFQCIFIYFNVNFVFQCREIEGHKFEWCIVITQ